MRNQFRGNLVQGEETFEKEETSEIVKKLFYHSWNSAIKLYIKICSVIITIFLLFSNKK